MPPKDESRIGKNYVVAKGPVNRRTASAPTAPQRPPSAGLKARWQRAHARYRLGVPLAQHLAATQGGQAGKAPPGTGTILRAIGATVSAAGAFLGLLQDTPWLTLAGFASFCGLGVWAYLGARRNGVAAAEPPLAAAAVVDALDIERLDATMEQLAAQSDQATVDQLAGLKAALTRALALAGSVQGQAGFLTEDLLYLRECVRRYIPDSIASYLQVPPKDRTHLLIDNSKSAQDLLHDQFGMLQRQLETRTTRLAQLAGEDLLRQQRFLAAKNHPE